MEDSGRARFPLDASVLQRLDNLALLTRRPMATGRPGRRRSPLAGSSMEFADYRRYSPGDDFRRIDWRAYARLERLFLRVFEAEENIPGRENFDTQGRQGNIKQNTTNQGYQQDR